MVANYLHGVETLILQKGPRPITVVKSAVIALIGTAPKGPKNSLTLVQSDLDAAQFGEEVPDFSIPKALDAILKQGAGTIVVINVIDEATNFVNVTNEALVISGGKAKLAFPPVGTTFTLTNQAGTTTFVKDTDYRVDDFGNITVLNSSVIAEAANVRATYKKYDKTTLTNSQIIGTVNSGTGVRTGLKCLELCYSLFGFTPKILCAPLFSDINAIAVELIATADKYRAIALLDAPASITPSAAIAGRGPAGTINFNTSSKRAYLLYPRLKAFDVATNANEDRPYSQFMAGVIAKTDLDEGYWVSPSNKEVKGIVGVERTITAAVNDASTEANLLNEKGITTIFNSFGSGIRSWGNRTAAFPTITTPDNFLSVKRTEDIIHESLEYAMLQFIDRPLNQATIDSIRESVNAFLRTLIGRGAIVDGICAYDKAKNPTVQLAAGQVVFDISFMPPTPAERITFESFIDINLLRNLA